MNLPNYIVEPGIPGSVTDLIECGHTIPRHERKIRFISSYQGQADYESLDGQHRIEWRYGKVPWKWSWEEKPCWNYKDEEEFQRCVNGAWGILHGFCSNPVGPTTLEVFRKEVCPLAVTGYFDHEEQRWVICEPTTEELGTRSYERLKAKQEAKEAKPPEPAAHWFPELGPLARRKGVA